MKTLVEVQNLKKNYGEKQAVKSISFKINENEILGLLGPMDLEKQLLLV